MKKTFKKAISVLLIAVMVLCTAPLSGLVGLDLPEFGGFQKLADSVSDFFEGFATKAEAATSGYYTYTVDENGNATIAYVDESISGNVAIPSTLGGYPVTSIGGHAFEERAGLTSVTIPDSVTSIGDSAFEYCTSLASVTIGNSVTSIGDSAFSGCYSLASVTIGNSVTSIGGAAFHSCYRLTSITIPDSVTSIGEKAFRWCYKLTSITIPDSVTSIGDSAFSGCDRLTSITIPDSVTSIGYSAFSHCDRLTSIEVDPANTMYLSDKDGVLFNKDKTELIQYPIGNTRTSYSIPGSITSIGDYAFCSCDSLTSVTIPDSVTSIGENAFNSCDSLASVTIGNGVTSIGDSTFSHCQSLASITIPDSVTSISDSAFYDCDGLASITIPDSVTSIGDSAFSGCYSLASVTIGNSVTSIGYYAFYDCDSLTSITIPDSVTSIGYYTFYDCDSLTSITIPDSVTSIGSWAFYDCDSLTSITIPDSVTSIDNYAFGSCNNLTDVYYSGTKSDWEAITIGEHDGCLTDATIHYGVYSITWSIDGKETAQEVKVGSKIIPPAVSDKEGYMFAGWNEPIPDTMPAENLSFVAVWVKINCVLTLDANGGKFADGSGLFTAEVEYGVDLDDIIPDEPVMEGHMFIGWTPKIPETMPANNMTFTAVWEKMTYTLTLDANGGEFADGSGLFTAEVEYGAELDDIIPGAPVMEGYTFTGWNRILPETMPANDIILKANYDTNIYQITFYTNGGNAIAPIRQEYGTAIKAPANPEKTGYTFLGWADEEGNPASIPATMPAENLSFYAVWDKMTYTLTLDANSGEFADGSGLFTAEVEYGAELDDIILDEPTAEGYIFVGWTPEVPATMPAKNLTFTAVWEEIPEENIYNLGEETYSFENFGDRHSPNGHCFGMAVTSSGYYTENLDITEIGLDSSDKLYTAADSAKVREPICYYFEIQGPGAERNSMVAGGNIDLYGRVKTNNDWNECVNYVKNHEHDNKGNLNVGMWFKGGGGHAVNFLYYKNVGGQDRLYVYDNNYPHMETYYYMGSDGYIHQSTEQSGYVRNVSIIGMDLMEINSYFRLAKDFKHHKFIYADSGDVSVSSSKMHYMKCGVNSSETVMYEIEDDLDQITIVPKEENSTFTYLGIEYRFKNKETGTFNLASSKNGVVTFSENIEVVGNDVTAEIRRPSTTTIKYGDSIILHADVDGGLPAGYTVKWTADNGNFSYKAEGETCTISPSKSGDTVFTATIYDADGNAVSTDEQVMTSKAGFFDKIIAFFKGIFGLNKTYPDIFGF